MLIVTQCCSVQGHQSQPRDRFVVAASPTLRLPLGSTRPRAITLMFCALRGTLAFVSIVRSWSSGGMVITIDACWPDVVGVGRVDPHRILYIGPLAVKGNLESFICLTFVHDIRCNSKIPGDLVWTIMMHTIGTAIVSTVPRIFPTLTTGCVVYRRSGLPRTISSPS